MLTIKRIRISAIESQVSHHGNPHILVTLSTSDDESLLGGSRIDFFDLGQACVNR